MLSSLPSMELGPCAASKAEEVDAVDDDDELDSLSSIESPAGSLNTARYTCAIAGSLLIEGPSTRSYPVGSLTEGEEVPPDLLPGRTMTTMPTIGSNDKPRIGTISEDMGTSSTASRPQTLTASDEQEEEEEEEEEEGVGVLPRHDLMVAESPQKMPSNSPRRGLGFIMDPPERR